MFKKNLIYLKTLIYKLAIAATLLFSGCSSPGESDKVDKLRVLGTINDDTVTIEQFEASYAEHLMATGDNDTPENRREHWFNLVTQSLLAQQAEEFGQKGEEYKQWYSLTKSMEAIEKYLHSELDKRFIEPTDSAARVAFVYKNTKIRASHLFSYRKTEIDSLYRRLKSGESFRDVANDHYSTTSYDSAAGSLGELEFFNLDYSIAKTAYQLEVGEYSKPVRSNEGYHIIRLDDFTRQPVITEASFKQKRESVTNLLRMGKNTEMGEQFVAQTMRRHDISINKENVFALGSEMKKLRSRHYLDDGQSIPKKNPTPKDIEWISSRLNPTTPVANYRYNGEKITVTAADYIKWMRYLPLGEAQNRIGASVGRVIRNEILLKYAIASNFLNDQYVKDAMMKEERAYLAGQVKDSLQNIPVDSADIPAEKLEKAFAKSGIAGKKLKEIDFWYLPIDNIKEGQKIRSAIISGRKNPEDYPGFTAHNDISGNIRADIRPHLGDATTGTIHILRTQEKLYLLRVNERKINVDTYSGRKDEIVERMKPYVHILKTLEKGRREADITLNEDIFAELLDLEPIRIK